MTRRFQFSIRLMLVATTVVAVAVGAANAQIALVAVAALDLMAVFLCSLAIIAATMTTGRIRAFWIGAAIPTAAGVAFSALSFHAFRATVLLDSSIPTNAWPFLQTTALELRAGLPPIWCLAIVNGLFCALMYWLIWPHPLERE